jgi:hypothetical protein
MRHSLPRNMINVPMQTDRQADGISKINFLHLIWFNTHKSNKISKSILFIVSVLLHVHSDAHARKQKLGKKANRMVNSEMRNT